MSTRRYLLWALATAVLPTLVAAVAALAVWVLYC